MNTMAMYLIGDIQGCDEPLQRLLAELAFSPSRDTLFLLGDLVNRGPASASVLRRLMGYGAAAQCVLGNHDLHLLALAQGARAPHRSDTVNDILQAPDRSAMLDWLRWQRLAILEHIDGHPVLMVHAGVLPSWTLAQTMARAAEVEQVLRSDTAGYFLQQLYGDEPAAWHEGLQGVPRWRMIVNALTRLRFCGASDRMEFATKEGAGASPAGYLPWFDVPRRQTADMTVAFGHWSTLGALQRQDVLSLDTGCVWGGCLSAMRLGGGALGGAAEPLARELIQVKCPAAQPHG
jgi:bis(5'-nucleosyl)-tetraphosphatase (symmetrical)